MRTKREKRRGYQGCPAKVHGFSNFFVLPPNQSFARRLSPSRTVRSKRGSRSALRLWVMASSIEKLSNRWFCTMQLLNFDPANFPLQFTSNVTFSADLFRRPSDKPLMVRCDSFQCFASLFCFLSRDSSSRYCSCSVALQAVLYFLFEKLDPHDTKQVGVSSSWLKMREPRSVRASWPMAHVKVWNGHEGH